MSFLDKLFGRSEEAPREIYNDLRSRVLKLEAKDVGLLPDASAPIYGIIMDTGLGNSVATFVCLGDGTVSLYTSTGGGVIGGGGHESVRSANQELLSTTNEYAEDFIKACSPVSAFPLPRDGQVFFYLLTTRGVFQAKCPEKDLVRYEDPFAALYHNCHAVMTEVRLVQERKEK